MSESAATPSKTEQTPRVPGKTLDILLIGGAIVGVLVMGVAWLGVEHDKQWSEARSVLVEVHAELEDRLVQDREDWESTQRRRIRQLEAEEPDGSDRDEHSQWREDLQDEREREYDRDVRRVLGLENGDLILLSLEWQGTLRHFRRGDFRFYAGGNHPSEESGQAYFVEVVGEPEAYDEDGLLEMPEGVLRIYSDGSIEGPLPLSEATDYTAED